MNSTKLFCFIIILFFCFACSKKEEPTSIVIHKSEYGTEWPYKDNDIAVLDCDNRKFGGVKRPVVTIFIGDKRYGLNGAAIGVGGYPDAKTLLSTHPEWGSLVIGASHKFLELGLTLCKGGKNT